MLIILMLFALSPAWGGTYADSAHGNASYGVDRDITDFPNYAVGNCAHCHEQHASIGGGELIPTGGPDEYLLFDTNFTAQTTNFCCGCHATSGSYQDAVTTPSPITNYSYSRAFGGNTAALTYDSDIISAFDHTISGSSHYLPDIDSQILGVAGLQTANNTAWSLNDNLNPCDACHNPHVAKRNYPVAFDVAEPTKLKTAISRPSDHDNLWGDDTTERMSAHTYQAPYWDSNQTTYEPANDAAPETLNGTKTPDYVTFCTDCHNPNNTINSTNPRLPDTPRTLRSINWGAGGDKHGSADGLPESLRAPYSDSLEYTLSCLDCHEPHGSTDNPFLLRTEVNDKSGISLTDPYFYNFCYDSCHIPYHRNTSSPCGNCHYHGADF